MKQDQGFSFIEVLISLTLLSSVALATLSELGQSRQSIQRSIFKAKASHYLDKIQEMLLVNAGLPSLPPPYKATIQSQQIRMTWLVKSQALVRKRVPL